jgi:hypothetical protein
VGAKREAAGLDKRKVGDGCGAPADQNSWRAERKKKLMAKRVAAMADEQARLVSMSMNMG